MLVSLRVGRTAPFKKSMPRQCSDECCQHQTVTWRTSNRIVQRKMAFRFHFDRCELGMVFSCDVKS